MTGHRSPAEQALDLFFYAPLGLLTEAGSLVPELAEKGRMQVGNAKIMGRFAVQLGRRKAESKLEQVQGDARGLLASWGLAPPDIPVPPPGVPDSRRAATPAAGPGGTGGATKARSRSGTAAPQAVRTAANGSTPAAPAASSLAIPDYDSLAASQVVARLAGLRPDELEDVHRYETAHRGRKTVLGRIAQLRG